MAHECKLTSNVIKQRTIWHKLIDQELGAINSCSGIAWAQNATPWQLIHQARDNIHIVHLHNFPLPSLTMIKNIKKFPIIRRSKYWPVSSQKLTRPTRFRCLTLESNWTSAQEKTRKRISLSAIILKSCQRTNYNENEMLHKAVVFYIWILFWNIFSMPLWLLIYYFVTLLPFLNSSELW